MSRPCRSGRARFSQYGEALAVVGSEFKEPGSPRSFVPLAVDDEKCPVCRGWHVRGPWSPGQSKQRASTEPWSVVPPPRRSRPQATRPVRPAKPRPVDPIAEARRLLGDES